MATTTTQRAGIWIIAIVLTVGTILGFIAMIIGQQNQADSQKQLQQYEVAYKKYQSDVAAQQKEVEGKAKAWEPTYLPRMEQYKTQAAAFDASSIKTLQAETLKDGTGDAIGGVTTYTAYYIGWGPDGAVFDSSFNNATLKSPLIVRPSSVISGWESGMNGKKIGGVYELTIPSDQAYGATGQGSIKPNTPLKFIVVTVEKEKTLQQPTPTAAVLEALNGQYQQQ